MSGVVSSSPSPESLHVGASQVPILFIRKPAAKRYILRLKQNGVLQVTIPRGGSKAFAQDFAARNAHWIQKQVEQWKARPAQPPAWQEGTPFLFRGEPVRLEIREHLLCFADQTLPLPLETQDFRPLVLRHLQQLALRELGSRTLELAQQHQLTVRRVTVRSQRTRWGSCSSKAHISLNWRLVQTPPYVADYIILHELMHLKHLNHSAKFWQCVAEVCPEFQKAEAWLKTHGKAVLH